MLSKIYLDFYDMKMVNNILLKTLGILLFAAVIITAGLGFQKPAKTVQVDNQIYEVLESNSWLGKELPIIDYIDIGEQLKTCNWLVLFYHYDCPDCINAIAELENVVLEDADLNIAIIEVPPYGSPVKTNCFYGRLMDVKKWFITTPVLVLMEDGKAMQIWEQELPDWSGVLDNIYAETKGNSLLAERR